MMYNFPSPNNSQQSSNMRPASHILMAFILTATLVVGAVLGAYWFLFGLLVLSSPLPFAELDLNHDGEVSFVEVEYAASWGEHAITVADQQCTEYFALKDGRQLKVVCPKRT